MRVAFCIREDYLRRRGGDTVQLLATRKVLEREYGVTGEIVTDPARAGEQGWDVCHVFNLTTERVTRDFFRCRGRGKTVLSTIFWDMGSSLACYFLSTFLGIHEISGRRIRLVRSLLERFSRYAGRPRFFTHDFRRNYVAATLERADFLLPNSPEELAFLSEYSGVDIRSLEGKSRPVVNGVDIDPPGEDGGETFRAGPDADFPRNYVLQVGSVSPLKNQYSLIRALFDDPELPIVIVGRQSGFPRYFRATRSLGRKRGNVWFLPEVEHEDLRHLYRRAAVHVLPSLQDTTGLASLEALACGCRAVVSGRGFCPYDFYFRGAATAVDPLDARSIRDGVLAELKEPRDMGTIRDAVRREFSWEAAARQTYEAYTRVLR